MSGPTALGRRHRYAKRLPADPKMAPSATEWTSIPRGDGVQTPSSDSYSCHSTSVGLMAFTRRAGSKAAAAALAGGRLSALGSGRSALAAASSPATSMTSW
jgi:hypothetical protein